MAFAKLVPKTSKTDCIRLSYSHQAPTWSHTVTHSPCASPWTRMPSGHRGQLSAACPGPRKMVPFLKFLRSSLKRFEEIGSSLKPSTVLQVHFTTSKPHDAGTPLQPAWYQPPQPPQPDRHAVGTTLLNPYGAKSRILQHEIFRIDTRLLSFAEGWCLSFCWFSGFNFQLCDDELELPALDIMRTKI